MAQDPNEHSNEHPNEKAELEKERARAEGLFRRLQACGDAKAQKALVQEDSELWSWALCERLCHESAAVADDDAELAGELASLALALAVRIPGEEGRRCELQEYAWMHVGNARRARGDLNRTEEAFDHAKKLFLGSVRGMPGPLDRGWLYGLEAALLRDQGRLSEALKKIDFALQLSRDESRRAAVLLEKGRIHRQLGQGEAAVEALSKGVQLVRNSVDAPLLVRIVIELAAALCDSGRYKETKILDPIRPMIAGSPFEEARLFCLDGRIAVGLGRLPEAEAALDKARAVGEDRAVLDLVLLSLELAALYARKGRTEELRNLAGQLQQLAETPGLSQKGRDVRDVREMAATLKLFSRLAAQEKLTAERAAQFAGEFARVAARTR
jgi:tetratricopeptide (TPR) repeat protein